MKCFTSIVNAWRLVIASSVCVAAVLIQESADAAPGGGNKKLPQCSCKVGWYYSKESKECRKEECNQKTQCSPSGQLTGRMDESTSTVIDCREMPASPPLRKCECQSGYHYSKSAGGCWMKKCVTKDVSCATGGSVIITGLWGPPQKIDCKTVPPQPPNNSGGTSNSGNSSDTGNGSNTGSSSGWSSSLPPIPPKSSQQPNQPPSAPDRCPGPDIVGEYGEVSDGAVRGGCQDEDQEPIPGLSPIPSGVPRVCFWAFRYCVGGCWFYDMEGVNLMPGPCLDISY